MSYKNKNVRSSAPKNTKRKWWVAAIIVLLVIVAFGSYWKFVHNRHKTVAVTASSNTKGEPTSKNTGNSTGIAGNSTTSPSSGTNTTTPDTSSNTSPKQDQTTPDTTGVNLLAPSGNFVSSHHIPAGNAESSVCTTSPGATCVITFVKDGATKSLASQTTDRGGSAYWNNWTPQSIGLTAGNWTVQATATLNGQTKSAADTLQLQVS